MMNSQKAQRIVSPAQAGVHNQLKALDSGLRRNDGNGRFQPFARPSIMMHAETRLFFNFYKVL